ncbi:MAG: efflux RND transporter periplasmic adaptor subunit [Candidatus Manganitrophaceae bacterium]
MTGRTQRGLWAVGLLLVVAGATWGVWRWFAPSGLPEGILEGYGRIEGTEVTVSSKVAGRLTALAVTEGDRVEPGALIAELSAEEIEARLAQANGRLLAAEKQVKQVSARLATVEHHADKARTDHRRYQALLQEGAISTQELDQSENTVRAAEGEVTAARELLGAARAEVTTASAARDEAQVAATERRITAPVAGTVVTKAVETGELLFPGKPIVVLVDLNRPYLRVYLPERDIGKVKLGDPARVYVDSFPGRPFEATVTEVANKAEFTPKDVHMPDERVTLVYSVKLEITNPEGILKPGMPADALIRWKPDADWGR